MDDLPYYVINPFWLRWREKAGARPATIASLSMDKAPPALPEPPTVPVAKEAPAPVRDSLDAMVDDIHQVVDAFSRFKTWVKTPAPSKPPQSERKEPFVPPFDIQEIPDAMRREGMPIGARLMERWFAGRLNYSPTEDAQKNEIDQNGQPYAPDMYDRTDIKLDWILRFVRAKEKYDSLISSLIYTSRAKDEASKKLRPFKDEFGLFFASEWDKDDVRMGHKLFEFQRVTVDGPISEKLETYLRFLTKSNSAPDDLYAALGSFVIYASIAQAIFDIDARGAKYAKVTGIWVYVKDRYTFDDPPGKRSQYLGHWGSDGIVIVPYAFIGSQSTKVPYFDCTVAVGDPRIKKNIYYPVHNSDFRAWQEKHKRGGDYMIFSDRKFVRLKEPVSVYL